MARALVIEEESGTTRATRHPHNGYYAGDFSYSLQSGSDTGSAVMFDFAHLRVEGATDLRQTLGWAA
jgi:hypothetical protein